jgi:hypothetical protein
MCAITQITNTVASSRHGYAQLNTRWSRVIDSSSWLSVDAQQLSALKALAPTNKIIIVYGRNDATCPFTIALEMTTNVETLEFDVEAHSIGHSAPKSPTAFRRDDRSDFQRWKDIRYPTPNGRFVIERCKKLSRRIIPEPVTLSRLPA